MSKALRPTQEQLEFLQSAILRRERYCDIAQRYTRKFKQRISKVTISNWVHRGQLKSAGRPLAIDRVRSPDVVARCDKVYGLYQKQWATDDIARAVDLSPITVRHIIKAECARRNERRRYFTAGAIKGAMAGNKRWRIPFKCEGPPQEAFKDKPQHPHAPSYGSAIPFDDLDLLPAGDDAVCKCRHWIGDPLAEPVMFCGRPSVPGKPYCEPHEMTARRAETAPPRNKETADKIKKQALAFYHWRKRRNSTEMREAA